MVRFFLLFFLLTVLALACKKVDERRYSTWYVDKDRFSSNNVLINYHRTDVVVNCYNRPSYFGFQFPDLTTGDTLQLEQPNLSSPYTVAVSFFIDTIIYYPTISTVSRIAITKNNGKFQWVIMPTWFIRKDNANDSVIIHGIFSEP